jgi:DNA-binding GntR family transcriptional regulator
MENKNIIDITNINEKVYQYLKDQIIHLTIKPGERINTRELRNQLQISQTPLKDALFRLAGEGLVEVSSRRGSFVRDITAKDIREIEDTRIILETGAVDVVARHITDDQINELEKLYEETISIENNEYARFMEKDNAYHLTIIKYANNDVLFDIYKKLNAHMQIVRYQFARQQRSKLDWTDKDHFEILSALKDRNPERAKAAMKRHLQTARDAFLKESSQ